MPPVTRIERFAQWAAGLSLESVPADVCERARLQAMNTVAAALAGAGSPSVMKLREATREWAAHGPAGVVGSGHAFEPAAAAYANAAASMAHDWDDFLYMGHTGHSAVWASRAVGDAMGASPDDILAAQIAANEVEGRLGAALFVGPQNGQLWSAIHCAGAAVAAGRLRGLEPEQLAHAMAIAMYQPPYGLWPGFMGPETKLLTAAEPVAQGIRAAALAERGFTGPLDVIENPRGFLAHFSFAPRLQLIDQLREVWLTDTLAYKAYPGCAYLQSAVEAVVRLQAEHGFDAGEIARMDVRAGRLTTAMEKLAAGEPLTGVRVNFSVALSTAVALLARRLTHLELAPAWLAAHDDAIRDLASRVFLEHDWDLTMQSLRGVGAGELAVTRLGGIRRRMQQTGMAEAGLGLSDIGELLRRTGTGALIRGTLAPAANGSAAPIERSALRLTFPAHVTIHLRSGGVLEANGRESGGSGAPLSEQQGVVDSKWEATREAAELPSVWRARPASAQAG